MLGPLEDPPAPAEFDADGSAVVSLGGDDGEAAEHPSAAAASPPTFATPPEEVLPPSGTAAAAAGAATPADRNWIVVPPAGYRSAAWRLSASLEHRAPEAEVPPAPRGQRVRGRNLGYGWVHADNGLFLPSRFLVPDEVSTPPLPDVGRGVVVHQEGAAVLATCEVPSMADREALDRVWLTLLPRGSTVTVTQRRGRRARITSPTDGWVSVLTASGATVVVEDTRPAEEGEDESAASANLATNLVNAVARTVSGTAVEKGLSKAEDAVLAAAAAVHPAGDWERIPRGFASTPEEGVSLSEERRRHALAAGAAERLNSAAGSVVTTLKGMAQYMLGSEGTDDAPGAYRTMRRATVTAGPASDSALVGELQPADVVAVLQVTTIRAEGRVRGRTAAPPGWMTLSNCDGSLRWAEPVEPETCWAAPPPGYGRVAWRRSMNIDDTDPAVPPVNRGERLRLQRVSDEWMLQQRGAAPPHFLPAQFLSATVDGATDIHYRRYQQVEVLVPLQFPSGKSISVGEVGIVRRVPGTGGTLALVEMPAKAGRAPFSFSARTGWIRHAGRFAVGQRVELVEPVRFGNGVLLRTGDRGTVRAGPKGGRHTVVEADADPGRQREGFLFYAAPGWLCASQEDVAPRGAPSWRIGDLVQWVGSDADIPEGAQGRVFGMLQSVNAQPPRVLVEFGSTVYSFAATQLRPAESTAGAPVRRALMLLAGSAPRPRRTLQLLAELAAAEPRRPSVDAP
eukprot:TRINITY_DN27570_c0_g2_i1.p1 TRINITY_DN27570_c0_g2~~TRINITY_DN27570_c0_g2_i1.p1  ORF type:complete len:763 (+),score=218.70 TRINITY_DN27570_c0_g2_i1:76-2289(+)